MKVLFSLFFLAFLSISTQNEVQEMDSTIGTSEWKFTFSGAIEGVVEGSILVINKDHNGGFVMAGRDMDGSNFSAMISKYGEYALTKLDFQKRFRWTEQQRSLRTL